MLSQSLTRKWNLRADFPVYIIIMCHDDVNRRGNASRAMESFCFRVYKYP